MDLARTNVSPFWKSLQAPPKCLTPLVTVETNSQNTIQIYGACEITCLVVEGKVHRFIFYTVTVLWGLLKKSQKSPCINMLESHGTVSMYMHMHRPLAQWSQILGMHMGNRQSLYQAASETMPCPPPPKSLCNSERWIRDSSAATFQQDQKNQSVLEINTLDLYGVFSLIS